jgi:hypothetical protein
MIIAQRHSIALLDFNTIDTGGGGREFVLRETSKKKQRLETKPKAILPNNLRAIILMDKHISKVLHRHDYDRNLSLRVVGAAVSIGTQDAPRELPVTKISENFSQVSHVTIACSRIFLLAKTLYSLD